MTIIATVIKAIGLPATVIIALLAYYEGVPGASRIPYASSIPIIGDLATGRVHAYAADQVAIATAAVSKQCEFDKSQMVSRAVADALAATLAQERRFRTAADIAASEADKRASEALRSKEAADVQIEALKAEAKDLPTWTKEEIEWLRAH